MKLFQYAAILHPTKKDREEGALSTILVPISSCLAVDERSAAIIAARELPKEHLDHLDRIEVAVRPF